MNQQSEDIFGKGGHFNPIARIMLAMYASANSRYVETWLNFFVFCFDNVVVMGWLYLVYYMVYAKLQDSFMTLSYPGVSEIFAFRSIIIEI